MMMMMSWYPHAGLPVGNNCKWLQCIVHAICIFRKMCIYFFQTSIFFERHSTRLGEFLSTRRALLRLSRLSHGMFINDCFWALGLRAIKNMFRAINVLVQQVLPGVLQVRDDLWFGSSCKHTLAYMWRRSSVPLLFFCLNCFLNIGIGKGFGTLLNLIKHQHQTLTNIKH